MTPACPLSTRQERAGGPIAASDALACLPASIAAPAPFYGLVGLNPSTSPITVPNIDLIAGLALAMLAFAQLPVSVPGIAWLTATLIGAEPPVPDADEVQP